MAGENVPTEPGDYWARWDEYDEWEVVRVWRGRDYYGVAHLVATRVRGASSRSGTWDIESDVERVHAWGPKVEGRPES